MNNFNYSQPKTQFSSYFNPTTNIGASTNNIIWVQGIEGAKAWQLAPNSMTILLDSETEGKMYIKVSDNIGMSTLRIFNYTEELMPNKNYNNSFQNNNLDLSQYVTKNELASIVKEILNEQFVSGVAESNAEQSTAITTVTTKQPQPKVILSGGATAKK